MEFLRDNLFWIQANAPDLLNQKLAFFQFCRVLQPQLEFIQLIFPAPAASPFTIFFSTHFTY